jgi:hypothetical protein
MTDGDLFVAIGTGLLVLEAARMRAGLRRRGC